jgi:predicted enzyme related to lactoylglutathione lyase
MDVYKTPGAFSWSELMTTDPAAAKAFYTELFGWGTRDMQMSSGTYTTCQVGEDSVGGIMKIPAEATGVPPSWGVYVTVEDVDATIRQAEQLGGSVIMPPMVIDGVGRMAVLKDPQGATFSVIKYSFPT